MQKTIRYSSFIMKKVSVTAFGSVLRQFRTARNMTQDELAARLDIASPYISRLESGHKLPSLDMVCKLAHALEVKPSELIHSMEERSE